MSDDTESKSSLPASMVAEIDAGVQAATEAMHKESGKDVEPEAAEAAPAVEDHQPEVEPQAPSGPSSSTLERAVRAGLSLEQAKQFPSDALLLATCDRIEGVEGGTSSSRDDAGQANGGESSTAEESLLDSIPDLDPDLYDDQIVAVVKAMKGIVKQQHDELIALRGGKSKDWFTTQLEGVKDYTKGDAAKEASVREKFDVLKAGYRAAGKNVTDAEVFEQAASLALGAEMEASRTGKKVQALRDRNGQFLRRPTSSRVEPKADAEAEVAAMLDARFF